MSCNSAWPWYLMTIVDQWIVFSSDKKLKFHHSNTKDSTASHAKVQFEREHHNSVCMYVTCTCVLQSETHFWTPFQLVCKAKHLLCVFVSLSWCRWWYENLITYPGVCIKCVFVLFSFSAEAKIAGRLIMATITALRKRGWKDISTTTNMEHQNYG